MNPLLFFLALSTGFSFQPKPGADLIIYHAKIYTVDAAFHVAEAVAIKDGKILETGTSKFILEKYEASEKLDANGKFVYPGFIDAHAHFYGYGMSLQTVNLVNTKSWEEVLDRTSAFAAENKNGWLLGRGWDQNDWTDKKFPDNKLLNERFPDRPVMLRRIDGHAAMANQRALELAGIVPGQKIAGGMIVTENGELTGLLVDNAVSLVGRKIPQPDSAATQEIFLDAQTNCFAAGLTSVDDCGLDFRTILFIDGLQKQGSLKMRIYAMLSDDPANFNFAFLHGKIKTDRLDVRAFKVYADGALGSRGACLLEPYSDNDSQGFLLSSQQHFDSVANILYKRNWQMCTHAIGDSGNRTMLRIYAKYLRGKNDRRWRIEHAQVINENDFDYFGKYNIIPSVQPTHATSDMYWAGNRLGPARLKGAYAYERLLQENGWIPLGTDFPVEDISPLKTFYAAVFRKDATGFPAHGFQMENALTRQQALRGMTTWAAKSNFEEKEKGSLEKGKFADLVILDTDLMTASPEEILKTKLLRTIVGGETVYKN
jgi:predicted amidohydrolase YtcJ